MATRIAALFDIDGTLIITGGAGAAAWRLAFDELYGIPADIGEFTDTGMTDPDVGYRTFTAVLGREPTRAELAKVMERRIDHLYQTVAGSEEYRVLEGVEELLPRMLEQGYLLGLVTGNVEAAAHIKLHRARLNRFSSFGGYGSDSTDRGELTRAALKRASVVSGGSVTPDQAFVVGDTPRTWPRPMPGRGPRRSPRHRRPRSGPSRVSASAPDLPAASELACPRGSRHAQDGRRLAGEEEGERDGCSPGLGRRRRAASHRPARALLEGDDGLVWVTLPITALSSIYGMNVIVNDRTRPVQLAVVLTVMAAMSVTLLRWARRRGRW
jgi:phosphoglycolate phosphatase